jgi:glycogen operon protein
VNYVCSHDGFTLQDLVSYEKKHNQANGEGNRDGHDHNLSTNLGVEGPTKDAAVLAERAKLKRALLATVFLSQGVPMLLMGDELSRTQKGNNNAYAQDNATNWLDWKAGAAADPALKEFVRALILLRRRFAAFRRRSFLTGAEVPRKALRDVYWLAPEGDQMTIDDWSDPGRQALGMQIGNDAPDGVRVLLLLNAGTAEVPFTIAPDLPSERWLQVFDSTLPGGLVEQDPTVLQPGGTFPLPPRSLVLFQHGTAEGAGG